MVGCLLSMQQLIWRMDYACMFIVYVYVVVWTRRDYKCSYILYMLWTMRTKRLQMSIPTIRGVGEPYNCGSVCRQILIWRQWFLSSLLSSAGYICCAMICSTMWLWLLWMSMNYVFRVFLNLGLGCPPASWLAAGFSINTFPVFLGH